MKYIFVRHGEPENCYGPNGEYKPSKKSGLSTVGIQQARSAGQLIKQQYNPKYIISSDTRRALETAQQINSQLNEQLEISENEEVREHHIYEDVLDSKDVLDSEYGEGGSNKIMERGAIPFEQAFAKCQKIIENLEQGQYDGDVVIATHGNIMRMLKFCAIETEPDYERYKSTLDGSIYSRGKVRNFCKMFAVDLDVPREQRKIVEMKIAKEQQAGKEEIE
ncbi:MAG: histidine phosphatase family protein [Firmicutes bacterium]|nr:histidine phosphatase family protein [Bacillota bacterium]